MVSKERFFSATLIIALTILAVVNKWVFIVALVGLITAALFEFYTIIKIKGIPVFRNTGLIIAAAIPLSIFFDLNLGGRWDSFFILLVFLITFVLQFARNDTADAITAIAATLFGVLYVGWFFSYLIKVRAMLPDMQGVKLLAFLLIVTKIADIGALIIGSRFGKRRLMPKISPNKTVEGYLGGVTFSVIAAIAFKSFLPAHLEFPIWHVIFIGFFFSTLGQMGDLAESLIKRDCNVKDSGNIIPAFGGILDTIDSLLFCAPAFYFYMSALMQTG